MYTLLTYLLTVAFSDERYFQLFEGQTDDDGRVNFVITTDNDNITQDNEKWVMLNFQAYNYHFMEELETAGEFITLLKIGCSGNTFRGVPPHVPATHPMGC